VLGNWAPGEFSFDGEHYKLDALDARPKPLQTPHPPLIMGGNAGPRSAALAARFADEYNTPWATLDVVRERREQISAACEAAGRAPVPISVMTAVITGTDEADLRARATRTALFRGLDPDEVLRDPPKGWLVGSVEQVAEQMRALGDAGVSRIMCQHLPHDDIEFVELLGRTVGPLVA
jgi:alkanesulfonate monooxygenase SsuD/methylene tetrahydromethanopterin reductase-like flavin-dependent oxidoreductase (luciferase family)